MNGSRQRAFELRQQLFDAVHDLDDIGARLALDIDDDGGGLVHPGRLLRILGIVDHVGHVGQHHRRIVAIGDDQRPIVLARKELIVRTDDGGAPGPVERALGLIDIGGRHGRAHIFEGQSVRGQRRRVGLNPDGGPLAPADADESYARELGDFLGQPRIRQIFHLRQRQGWRRQRQREDRRVSRIHLAVHRRVRQLLRQESGSGIDRRLHLLLGNIQAQRETKLQRNDRAAP